jgi:hypothetical protein
MAQIAVATMAVANATPTFLLSKNRPNRMLMRDD